jgi:peptidyl-Asp metalloendopeptidase
MSHPYHYAPAFAVAVYLPLSALGQELSSAFHRSDAPLGPSPSPAAVEYHPIELDLALLGAEAGRAIELPLPGGSYRAVRTSLESRGPLDFTWRGRLDALGGGDVLFSVRGGAVSGLLYAPDAVYEIIPRGKEQILARLDPSRFPSCGGAIPPGAVASGDEPPVAGDPAAPIDVLVLYTTHARTVAGSTSAIEALVQGAIDAANTAYANSQIATRLHLAHTEEVAHDDSDFGESINWVSSDATVAKLRDTYRADLVDLLIDNTQYCGLAYVMNRAGLGAGFAPYAFSVVYHACAVGNLSFAHELGHNMGCEHDPANGEAPDDASYPYSFGHLVDGSFRTVMSYATKCPHGCTRVAYFSNPNVSYSGVPTGIADQRDNHRTINNTAAIVAGFRQAPDPTAGFYTVTPCRAFDTRINSSPLRSGASILIPFTGVCGVPASARSVSVTLTVTQPGGAGYLTFYPGNQQPTTASSINFIRGQTRTNNAILALATDGSGTLGAQGTLTNGSVQVIVDVNGYFQ